MSSSRYLFTGTGAASPASSTKFSAPSSSFSSSRRSQSVQRCDASTPPPQHSMSPTTTGSAAVTTAVVLATVVGGSEQGGERAPMEMAPLFPRYDFEHWLIVMYKPARGGRHQAIDDLLLHPDLRQSGGVGPTRHVTAAGGRIVGGRWRGGGAATDMNGWTSAFQSEASSPAYIWLVWMLPRNLQLTNCQVNDEGRYPSRQISNIQFCWSHPWS
ncbi:hypothetical protein ACP4OV_012994 [Aristida adscensionis]